MMMKKKKNKSAIFSVVQQEAIINWLRQSALAFETEIDIVIENDIREEYDKIITAVQPYIDSIQSVTFRSLHYAGVFTIEINTADSSLNRLLVSIAYPFDLTTNDIYIRKTFIDDLASKIREKWVSINEYEQLKT